MAGRDSRLPTSEMEEDTHTADCDNKTVRMVYLPRIKRKRTLSVMRDVVLPDMLRKSTLVAEAYDEVRRVRRHTHTRVQKY